MSGKKSYQIDMCHGPLFSQIFRFSLPLMGTTLMTLLFHAADLIVLGQFATGHTRTTATAAVGCTSALNVILLLFFSGFSAGVNAVTSRYIGAKDEKRVFHSVHSAITFGIYGGIVIALIGVIFSRTVLRWMGTPEDVLDKATIYLQICSIGLPFLALYTIGAALLRSAGDTKRPLYYITIAGVVNVLLNIFFVVVCKMDAAGVALATKISNVLSAALIIRALCRFGKPLQLNLKKLHIHWETLKDILWIGIPAGIQSALYSVSNLFIQSSVNSLGSFAMAGNAASQSLEGMASIASGAYYQTAMSFTGQNLGGKKYKRIIKSILICLLYAALFGLILGSTFIIFGKHLLGLYNPDTEVVRVGMQRLVIMMASYWLCAIMDTVSGSLRGLGHSIAPTITTIMGACVLRICWALAVFPHYRTLSSLMISYPVSWILTGGINAVILFFVCRKMMQNVVGNKKYILCPKA